jgi:hypothetical protein
VSQPIQSNANDDPSLALARRFTDTGGHFAGVVVSTIKLSAIYDLIHAAARDSSDTITLLSEDGHLIARQPWDERLVGRNLKRGPL